MDWALKGHGFCLSYPPLQTKTTLRCVCGSPRMFLVTTFPKAGQPLMEFYRRASQCVGRGAPEALG